MARYKLGDRVRREIVHKHGCVRVGRITAVIPNQHGLDMSDEYEVDFGVDGVLIAYDRQLEPVGINDMR